MDKEDVGLCNELRARSDQFEAAIAAKPNMPDALKLNALELSNKYRSLASDLERRGKRDQRWLKSARSLYAETAIFKTEYTRWLDSN